MIDTAAVRTKILLLAMKGKLSEQKETDGVAIPSDKVVSDSSKDANAYIIPRNWKWVRVKDVVAKDVGGGTPSKAVLEYWENGEIPWATVKDFSNAKGGYINETIDHITTEGLKNSASNVVDEEAIVVCMRMALGKIVRLVKPMAINQDLRALWLESFVLPDYFVYFYKTLKVKGRGTTVSGIRKEELMNYAFPVPPIEEQKRIVSKVDDIYELLDTIDILQTQYASNVEVLKNKLIDAGIRGKLTEQLPEDGVAEDLYNQIQDEKAKFIKEGKIKKEKFLPDISEDEIPFEIPKSWKWVRLGKVINEVIVPQRDKPTFSGNIPWCRIEDRDGIYLNGTKSGQYVSEQTVKEMNLRIFPVGTVLSACSGASIGTILINTVECCTNQTFNGLVCNDLFYNWYLFWFLKSEIHRLKSMGSGSAMAYISQDKIRNMLIPLPPIAEQRRIVEKIDVLLNVFD